MNELGLIRCQIFGNFTQMVCEKLSCFIPIQRYIICGLASLCVGPCPHTRKLVLTQHPTQKKTVVWCIKVLTMLLSCPFDFQCLVFKQLSQTKYQCEVDAVNSILTHFSPTLRRAIECCQEKGTSSWLSALLIEQYGFALHKTDFHLSLELL